jgi:hypothetical protein
MQWIREKLYQWLFVRFRRKRMRQFFEAFHPLPRTRVLDIGGVAQTWMYEATNASSFPVTLLNILDYGESNNERFTHILGDATAIPFVDNAFDIVFSNSVIEHVTTWEKQQAFAQEVRRAGRGLWIQTPARSFPIEAHLWAPWMQYLPRKLQYRIAPWTPRGILQPDVVRQIVAEVRLLTRKEMQTLFPDCVILQEKVLGLTKSYIAVRGYNSAPHATTQQ